MLYRFLAEAVLVVHLGFVVFAVGGGLLALRWRSVRWLHLPAAAWAALVVLVGWTCPLTPLENDLRLLAGQSGYSGGFLEHYIVSVLYPAGLTREIQVALGLIVVAINLWVYVRLHRHAAGASARQSAPAGPEASSARRQPARSPACSG